MWGFGWEGFADLGAAGAALWVDEFRLPSLPPYRQVLGLVALVGSERTVLKVDL